jgi:hypothetical protein
MAKAGEFIKSVLEFIKFKHPDVRAKWDERADRVIPQAGALPEQYRWLLSDADGSIPAQVVLYRGTLLWKGRSKEQAGAMLFSRQGWQGQEDFVRNGIWHHNLGGELTALENEIWKKVHNAPLSGDCLLKGYASGCEKPQTVPPELITLEALLEARDSGVMVLNGVKWAGLRLVMVGPEAPASDSASHNEENVNADVKPVRLRSKRELVFDTVGKLTQEGCSLEKYERAEQRQLIGKKLGANCPSRQTLDRALDELGFGK